MARTTWLIRPEGLVPYDAAFSAMHELADLRARGGQTVVDLTLAGDGRDPHALRRLSQSTGVKIVMATGGYRAGGASETRTDALVRDITLGVADSGVRAGILGEIDLGAGPCGAAEVAVLRATAQASRRTGAAISLAGPIPGEILRRALDVLESEGVDLARVIVGGLDPLAAETERLEQLLARGIYLQFDMLGRYPHVRSASSDRDVAAAVVALVRRGHARRILLSQDVRTKIQLKTYGGTGYAFVFEQFVPYLRRLGLTGDEIETILATNPARMLTLAEPKYPYSQLR